MADSLQVAGVRLVVEGAKEYQAQLKESSQALSQNAAEQKKLEEQYGRGSKSSDYLTQKQQLLNKQLAEQQKRTQALRDTLAAYEQRQDAQPDKIAKINLAITRSEALEARYGRQIRETGEALADTQGELADTETALDSTGDALVQAGQDANKARGGIRAVGEEASDARARLTAFGNAAIEVGNRINKVGGWMNRRLTLPIVGAFAYAAREAIGFEEAYANVAKTFRGTSQELATMREEVIALSTSGLVTQNKEEISEVAALANQLGIQTGNVITFSTAMLQMGDATNLASTEAAESLAKFANITGMSQNEFSNLGSAIVDLGNNTAAQENAIVALGMRLAAAGTTAKMSVASVMGISAAFSSVGMEAEAGGTAVSKLIIDMDTSVAKGAKAANKYAKIAGMTAKQFQDLWKQDSAGGFTAFISGLQRIKEEGGNVALTLEKIGIKDQRMRDAMLRAVNAGDLLGSSIARSNQAYRENTALAQEAAAKNSTFAARMRILGNRFDAAAMSMGESLMPLLEKGMSGLQKLVDAFGALDEGQRQTIITSGLLVAGLGPVIQVVGNVTKAVGFASKALGVIGLPGGAILAGVAAFGALAFALSTIKTPLEQVQQRMSQLEFKFDAADSAEFQAGIEKGIAAAKKEYEIEVQVKAEMNLLEDSLDGALDDGKISGKERKSLKKQLDELIKKDIDAAQLELKTSVDAYVATLSGLKDASGEDLFTEEEKAAIVEDLKTKTSALTEQLEGYQAEYNALIDTVYKQQKPVTTQQMAEMNALLEQIGIVRAQIKLANDEAYAAAEAMYNLTIEGRGNEETAGAGMGYTDERERQAQEQAQTERDAALAAIAATVTDTEAQLDKQERVIQAYDQKVAEAADSAQDSYNKLFAGVAKQNQGLTDQVAEAAAAVDTIQAFYDALETGGYSADSLRAVLTPEILLEFTSADFLGVTNVDELFSLDVAQIDSIIQELEGKLAAKAAEGAGALAVENPLTGYLKEAFAKGIVLDPTVADGALADVMTLLDFAGKGSEFGLDFTNGIGTAIDGEGSKNRVKDAVEGLGPPVDEGAKVVDGKGAEAGNRIVDGFVASLEAGIPRVQAAAAALGNAAEEGLNSKEGIDAGSPSKKSRRSGTWFVQGFTGQIASLTPMAAGLAGELGGSASEALNAMLARPRLPAGVALDYSLSGNPDRLARAFARAAGVGSGQGATTINESVPINIQNLNVRRESDIRAIGLELEANRRRARAGRGS